MVIKHQNQLEKIVQGHFPFIMELLTQENRERKLKAIEMVGCATLPLIFRGFFLFPKLHIDI
jgi:hypothetical protein